MKNKIKIPIFVSVENKLQMDQRSFFFNMFSRLMFIAILNKMVSYMYREADFSKHFFFIKNKTKQNIHIPENKTKQKQKPNNST